MKEKGSHNKGPLVKCAEFLFYFIFIYFLTPKTSCIGSGKQLKKNLKGQVEDGTNI